MSTLSLVTVPLTLSALLWNGAVRRRDVWIDLDPFEIDLQLRDRNDEAG